jgi:hypothetical protein
MAPTIDAIFESLKRVLARDHSLSKMQQENAVSNRVTILEQLLASKSVQVAEMEAKLQEVTGQMADMVAQIQSLQQIVQDLQGANADPAQMRAREMSKELKLRVNGKHNNQ